MTSFIIVSQNKQKREEYAVDFCRRMGIAPVDVSRIEIDLEGKQASIGIEDVKLIQKKIFFKPIKSEKKAVIIEDAQLLTTQAQNALLKVLEEPPEQTILLLGTASKDSLLPTILSRCQIVVLEPDVLLLTEKEAAKYIAFIEQLSGSSINARLKKAETLAKDKEKALVWIEKLIIILRESLLRDVHEHPPVQISYIQAFQELHTLLKTTNVNPRMAIEMTLLSI